MNQEVQVQKIYNFFPNENSKFKYLYITDSKYSEKGSTITKKRGIKTNTELYVGDFILAHQKTCKNYKNFIFDTYVSAELHLMIKKIHESKQFKKRDINKMSTYVIEQYVKRKIETYNTLYEFVCNITRDKRPKGMSIKTLLMFQKILIDTKIHAGIKKLKLVELIELPVYSNFLDWLQSEQDDANNGFGHFDALSMIRERPYEIIFYNDFAAKTTLHRKIFIKKVSQANRILIVKSIVGQANFKLPIKIRIIDEMNKYLNKMRSNWCIISEIERKINLYVEKTDIEEIVKEHTDTFVCVKECITFQVKYKKACEFERYLNQIKIKYVEKKIKYVDDFDCITEDIMQIEAIKNAINEPVSIIFGQAGTGKTSVIKDIVEYEIKRGLFEIVLLAPTGKAVTRLKDVVNCNSLHIRNIYTVHHINKTGGTYIKDNDKELQKYGDIDSRNPWFVILDEQSMQCFDVLFDFLSFFSKKGNIGKILFVGDKNQLPPIGNGQIFKDLINTSAYPKIELNTIFRTENGVNINQNAKSVRSGDICLTWSSSFVTHTIYNFVDILKIFNSFDERPVILCDTKKDVWNINNMVQNALLSENSYVNNDAIIRKNTRKTVLTERCNTNIITEPLKFDTLYSGWRYFLGETVMCVKNIYSGVLDDKRLIISNGSQGVIYSINNDYICVEFNDDECGGLFYESFSMNKRQLHKQLQQQIVTYNNNEQTAYHQLAYNNNEQTAYHQLLDKNRDIEENIDSERAAEDYIRPDYAFTVDKSQGSEYKNVIYLCVNNFRNSRELLYTAITRAKRKVVIVNKDMSIISKCIQTKWKSKPSKLFQLDNYNHGTFLEGICRERKSKRGVNLCKRKCKRGEFYDGYGEYVKKRNKTENYISFSQETL